MLNGAVVEAVAAVAAVLFISCIKGLTRTPVYYRLMVVLPVRRGRSDYRVRRVLLAV